MPAPESRPFRLPPVVVAVAPYLDPKTWGAIAYIWLGFPLGLAWFIGMTVGFVTGLALTLIWIGLALLAATLLAVWGAEGLERQLAILLLGARVPERRVRRPEGESAKSWIRSVAKGPALWKGIFFLALRFPLGLLGWVASVVSLSVSVACMMAPWIYYFGVGHVDIDLGFGLGIVDSGPGSWALAVAGMIGLVISLHLHRGLGWIWARLAERLLGGGPEGAPTEAQPPSEWTAPSEMPGPATA